MTIDPFVYNLAILLLPGFVSLIILKSIIDIPTDQKNRISVKDFFVVLAISLFSGILLDASKYALDKLLGTEVHWIEGSVFRDLTTISRKFYSPVEFLILILISIIIGFLIAKAYNKRVLFKIAKRLKISTQFGNHDLWTEFFDKYCIDGDYWIYVRDFKRGLTYFGAVQQFSDTGEKRELIMIDVKVFDTDDSFYLYEVPVIYISLIDEDFSIEKAISEEGV
jgi:hypothetical protein